MCVRVYVRDVTYYIDCVCVSVCGAVMLYGLVSAACMCVLEGGYVFEVRCLKPRWLLHCPG